MSPAYSGLRSMSTKFGLPKAAGVTLVVRPTSSGPWYGRPNSSRQTVADVLQVGGDAGVVLQPAWDLNTSRTWRSGHDAEIMADARPSGAWRSQGRGRLMSKDFGHLAAEPCAGVKAEHRHGQQHVHDHVHDNGGAHRMPGGHADAFRAAAERRSRSNTAEPSSDGHEDKTPLDSQRVEDLRAAEASGRSECMIAAHRSRR